MPTFTRPASLEENRMPESTVEERELDLAALIALWYAIHGGDPSPSEVTIDDETVVLIAAALDRNPRHQGRNPKRAVRIHYNLGMLRSFPSWLIGMQGVIRVECPLAWLRTGPAFRR